MSDAASPSQFPEIAALIERELAKMKAAGKPLRVNIWDENHHSAIPHLVVSDPEINRIAKKFGNPLYAVEAINAKAMQEEYSQYSFGSDAHRAEAHKTPPFAGLDRLFAISRSDMLDKTQHPTRILFPDQREAPMKKIVDAMPAADRKIYDQFEKITTEYAADRPQLMAETANFIKSLSPEQRDNLFGHLKQLLAAVAGTDQLDTSAIDQDTSAVVKGEFNPENDVLLTIYGVFHYTKPHDLDEINSGLSILVTNEDGLKDLRYQMLGAESRDIHKDLPEYVYYADQKRLVHLDSDGKKAELLGLSGHQFEAWKQGQETFAKLLDAEEIARISRGQKAPETSDPQALPDLGKISAFPLSVGETLGSLLPPPVVVSNAADRQHPQAVNLP